MSSPKVLTVARIDAANAKEARYELPDAGLPSFYLVVQPSGAKSFALRYRAEGKPRKYTIGSYPKFTLEEARRLAREAIGKIARGDDPSAEKKAARRPSDIPQTFDDLAAKFTKLYPTTNKRPPRPRSWEETQRSINRVLLPAWKGRRLDSIHHRDANALLNKLKAEYRVKGNRVLAAGRRMYNWGIENDLVEVNPFARIKAAEEVSRDRVLSDSELGLVARAMKKLEVPFGPYVRMLAITLQRRNEVAGMRWSEISEGIWTLPASRTKNGIEHILPLPAEALRILDALKATRIAESGYVFSSTGKSSISGFAKLKKQIDKLIAAENGEPIAPWRLHDLRRTGASKMPRLGVALPVVEKILNHTSGSFAGIVGVYQRHDFADEKRTALEKWAAFLERLSGDAPDNVIKLASA